MATTYTSRADERPMEARREDEGIRLLPVILLLALLGLGVWALSQITDDTATNTINTGSFPSTLNEAGVNAQ